MYCRTWGCEAYDKLIEHTLERRRKPICSQCVKVLYRYCKTCGRFENYNRANDNHLCGYLVGDDPCGGTLHSPKHNKTRSTCHEFQPTKSGHAPNYGIRGDDKPVLFDTDEKTINLEDVDVPHKSAFKRRITDDGEVPHKKLKTQPASINIDLQNFIETERQRYEITQEIKKKVHRDHLISTIIELDSATFDDSYKEAIIKDMIEEQEKCVD